LRLLVGAKADLDIARLLDGATPARLAGAFGKADALRVLASAKADLDRACHDGSTATVDAAAHGRTDVLDLLVAAKADIDRARPSDGATPTMLAAASGHGLAS
jgi:ankyrin repeat protein